jgi:predicted alpha/beta-fold hydrolase
LLPFDPLFRNPHLATIAGSYWSRPVSKQRWPVESVIYRTAPDVQVLVHAQRPSGEPKGEIILIHGLEGSSVSGYALSLSHRALELGYAMHRLNMRGCGGTEHLATSGYHAGQTWDVLAILRERRAATNTPLFLAGFSLGGNVVLKLAGELQHEAKDLLAGVCAVSAPLDLAACTQAIEQPQNFLYQRRFLACLKGRIRRRHLHAPDIYTLEHLPKIRTIADFDEYYTSKLFGFGTAANYFRTQSSNQFLEHIQIPALLIQAQDDPMIPFSVYDLPVFKSNPNLTLVAARYGGHLGFLSRQRPRFWVDEVITAWLEERNKARPRHV